MATTSYPSMPLYDVQRNDFVNQNYQATVGNGGFDMGSNESFYPLSLNEVQAPFPYPLLSQKPGRSYFQPQMGFAQTFPTNGVAYNGGLPPTFQPYNAVPYFQTQPSFSSVHSPTSGPSTSAPPPVPLSKEVHKANTESKAKGKRVTRNATQSVKGKLLISKPKRQRGPNKRPPGTAFSNLLDGLPNEIREALERDYLGCCELANIKDLSTKQKHMFSNKHCKNLPSEFQEQIPSFVCPAFVAFKGSCRSKAGRYDSTDRHCKNCAGFDQINKGNLSAYPVVITRSQYSSILNYRMTHADCGGEKQATDQSTVQAYANILMVLAEVFKDGFPDWFPLINLEGKFGGSGAIVNDTAQLPMATNSTSVVVPVASNCGQSSPYEPSPFDPDSANGCAGASENGFPATNLEGESNNSGTAIDPSVQLSAMSVPPSHYELSLFDPETANECAEALKNEFPAINLESESNVAQSSTSVPVPAAQSVFYEPPRFDPEKVDSTEWGPLFSSFT